MDKSKLFKVLGTDNKSKLSTAITLALLTFIAGALFVRWYGSSIDFLRISEKESNIHYTGSLVRDIGLWVAAALVVISTIVKYSSEPRKWVANFRLFCTIGVMLVWSFGFLHYYYQMVNINEMHTKITDTNPNIVQEVESFLQTTDMDRSELETMSIQFAKTIFREIGQTTTVYSTENGFNKYEPTDEDLKQRQESIQAEKLKKYMENGFFSGFLSTLFVLLIAVSIGLIYNKYTFSRWL